MIPRRLLAPDCWLAWFGIGLLRIFYLLPFRLQLAAGVRFGRLLYHLFPKRRRIAAINIGLCFPDKDAAEREKLLRAHFDALGRGFAEMAIAWWATDRQLEGMLEVRGREHLDAALAKGNGALVLCVHSTAMEIIGRMLKGVIPLHVTFREQNNPVMDWMFQKHRGDWTARAIHRFDVRGMVRSLRGNNILWYAADQDYGPEHSVFVPFFGVPTASISATAKLAKMTGTAILPFSPFRESSGQYVVEIKAALPDIPSGDLEADTTRVNAAIEAMVTEHPETWLWVHRRFKSRPPGTPSFY